MSDSEDELCSVEPPLYVCLASAMLEARGVRVYSATAHVSIVVTREAAYTSVTLSPSPTLAARRLRDTEHPVLIDALVHTQCAASLPVDVRLVLGAEPLRSIVVYQRAELSARAERALPRSIAYAHRRPPNALDPILFNSLDAHRFDADALRAHVHRVDEQRVAVPRSCAGVELVRAVARAQQLESLDALTRSCTLSDDIDGGVAVGSSLHVYESRDALESALTFIERSLVPVTRLGLGVFDEARVEPLDGTSWAYALRNVDDAALPARASVELAAWFCVLE